MSSSLKKVAFTCYPVRDLARSRAFYEGVLGLQPGDNLQGAWQEYDLDGTTFAITSMILKAVKPGTQSSVAFEVNDLKNLMQELRKKNVEFDSKEPMESPFCWIAFLKDPDGNTVTLHQLKE